MTTFLPIRYAARAQKLHLLDQRRLPFAEEWVVCSAAADVADAIQAMVVRGAPAIGVSAAYGMLLAHVAGEDPAAADARLRRSRPTAVNLAHALDRVRPHWGNLEGVREAAVRLHRAVEGTERAIGFHGARVLRGQVLTHCNTGPLATGGYGTAFAAIVEAWRQGRVHHVWVDETRPYLQGARLTAWELGRAGVPCTLITDSMAAALMGRGEVQAVVVGADRMAMNGDFANKIGTYGLAVLARHHGIPFYVALPTSTVDPLLPDGSGIPIEERTPDEVRSVMGVAIAEPSVQVRNPAFDVTPHALVTGIVTEGGVIHPPFDEGLREALSEPR